MPAKLREPRSLVPFQASDAFRGMPLTGEDVKDVILSSKDLRATYLFGNFDGALVSTKVPSAAVMVNKKTRRLAIVVNPRFVKHCMLAILAKRHHRSQFKEKSRQAEFGYTINQLVREDDVKATRDLALRYIIKYEFSHVWFQHIERASDLPENLLALVHGSLSAFHLNIGVSQLEILPAGSDRLFYAALMFLRWVKRAADPQWTSLAQFKKIVSSMVYSPNMADENYLFMRCFQALRERKSERHTDSKLTADFYRFVRAVSTYSEGVEGLAKMLASMFPELEDPENEGKNPMRPPPKGRQPPCGGPPPPGIGASSGGEGEDPEDDEQEGPENPDDEGLPQQGKNKNDQGPEDKEPPDQQIDPRKEDLEHDGEDYVPLGCGDVPPDFDDQVGDILKAAGASGKFTSKVLEEVEQAKLSRESIKAVLHVSTKSLIKSAKQALDIHRKPSPIVTSIVPNRHPVVNDMVLNNALMLRRPPRYKPVTAREDDIKRKKVRIYIDVSYSMQSVWPEVLGFVLALKKHCDLTVFQFSTEIIEVSMEDLAEGRLFTRGGTCVTPIVEDIVEASRICEAFTVLGDRAYSGLSTVPKVAQPIKMLDIGYTNRGSVPYFRTTDRCLVHYANLDDEFNLLEDGVVERTQAAQHG